ncbi:MAG: DUF6089 family protein [Chitinophagales bacterium]
MKNIFIVVLLITAFSFKAKAQETEVGVWAGAANYFGDLNPVFSFKEVRWAGGMFYRHNFNPRMAVRAGMNYARIAASDAKNEKSPYPQYRNLSFESDIIEFTGTYEINFFKYQPLKNKNFTPYLFVGISVFYYNPFTMYNGNKESLQSLGTEGQNTPFGEDNKYTRYSLAIPFGGGLKYALNKNWALNLEVSSRRTFTDYIDDVSDSYVDPDVLGGISAPIADPSEGGLAPGKQRGTAKDVDRFNFYGVAVTYTIQTNKCPTISNKGF